MYFILKNEIAVNINRFCNAGLIEIIEQRPRQHSSYAMAEEDVKCWNKQRYIPKDKLVLELSFYSYGFSAASDSTVVLINFKNIVAVYSDPAAIHLMTLHDKKIMYYGSASDIEKKTKLAIKKRAA